MTTLTIEPNHHLSQAEKPTSNFVSDFQKAMESLGDQYGIYEAMSQTGPVTSTELAGFIGLPTATVKMWLKTQASGGYIHYSRPADRYCLWCPIKRNRPGQPPVKKI
jgi:hypothetical protein